MTSNSVTVWEVNYDSGERSKVTDESILATRRFASAAAADTFASTVTADGQPARARKMSVARRIAASWGMA